MDGDDLHQVLVALQPQLGGVITAGGVALGLQPAQQGFGRGQGGAGLVQQLTQVQQVGEPARAVGRGQQALCHLLGLAPLLQHHAHATLAPQAAVAGVALHQVQPGGFVTGQGVDGMGFQAVPAGGQRRLQQAAAAGLQHGGQHPLQVVGIGTVEHAGLRQLDAAHAQRGQRLAHPAALGMAAHQHGDVAGSQRPAAQGDVASTGLCQQAGDLGGAGGGGALAGLQLGGRAAAGARQRPHLQWGAGLGGIHQRRLGLGAFGHRVVAQAGLQEGVVVLGEEAVQRADQRADGALVLAQGVRGQRLAARLQVGVQVGMAEAVDRLLGVAHQEQRRPVFACRRRGVDAAEHGPLQRVGVLELIDQRSREALAQRGGQAGRAVVMGIGFKALVQVGQHVVEGHHPLGALGSALLRGAVLQQPAQQAQAGQLQGPGAGGGGIQQLLGGGEERVCRRCLAFLGAQVQHGCAQQGQAVRQGGRWVVCCQHSIPVGHCGLHLRGLVVGAMQPGQAVEQQGQHGITLAGPGGAGRGPGSGQRRPARCAVIGGVDAVGPQLAGQRPGQLALQQLQPAGGAVAARQQVGGQHRVGVGAGHMAAPEVVHRLGQQGAVVGQQVLHQRHLRGQRGVGQRALAEAVDGEDGRFVEAQQRGAQAGGQVGRVGALGLQAGQQPGHEGVGAGGGGGLQPGQGVDQALAQPFTQLGGGSIGEGDHQDLLHREPPLQQQAQHQAADRPRLAGAGRCLDQPHAAQRHAEDIQCLRVGHAAVPSSRWANKGSST